MDPDQKQNKKSSDEIIKGNILKNTRFYIFVHITVK